MIKLDSKLGVWTSRGGLVWADHRRSHRGLTMLPEGVLTENKIGQVEWQTCGLPDPHLCKNEKNRMKLSEHDCSLSYINIWVKCCLYPAGQPLGHVDDLSVGVHHLVAATLTGVLRRIISSTQPLRNRSTDSHQLNVQPPCYLKDTLNKQNDKVTYTKANASS